MSVVRKLEPNPTPASPLVAVPNAQLERARNQLTTIVFAVVLVLGFGISVQMLQPPAGLELNSGSGLQVRNPASVAGVAAQLPDQAVEVQTTCEPLSEIVIPAVVNQIRLLGSTCSSKSVYEHSEINNVTNGYAATVFYPTPTEYTTDYISLARDENVIHITHFLKKAGRETRELRVRRQ